jgi:alpha-1,3-rhamnosyl/mannosyltransferase
MSEPPQDPFIDPASGLPWTGSQRVKRALARRLPRTARSFHWLRAKLRHYAGRAWQRLLGIPRTGRWLAFVGREVLRRRRQAGLTVGIDITPLWDSLTGVGWYLYRLIEQLAGHREVTIRLYGPNLLTGEDVPGPKVALPVGPHIEHVAFDVPHGLVFSKGWFMGFVRGLEPLLIALDRNRVLFAPNYFLPRRFLLAGGGRVTTIHDLGLHRVPDTLQEETREALGRHLERSTARSRRLIAVSGAVRDELVELGYAPAEKIDVIHHGPGQLAAIRPTRLPDGVEPPFALHVGTLEPRKNILALLAAWRTLEELMPSPPPLLLCGKFGWKSEEIEEAVAAAGRRVRHLGYVDEGELAALYAAAAVVVFPTLYEGFGLPAVEAQQAGAPLVCSDLPVLREVAGDGAVFAPSDDPVAFARAIAELLQDDDARRAVAERGRQNAATFSWSRAAEATIDSWRAAADAAP